MKESAASDNRVTLKGKVSRRGRVVYTPSGSAMLEFLLAVEQKVFLKKTNGYFTILLTDDLAHSMDKELKIGRTFSVVGSLWSREFLDRKRNKVSETKVVALEIEGE